MQSLALRYRRHLVLLTLLASLAAGVSSIVADPAKAPLTVLVSLPPPVLHVLSSCTHVGLRVG